LPSVLEPLAQSADQELKAAILDAAGLKPGDFVVLRLTMGAKPKVIDVERCFATVD
jgi:hypothetical protein